MKEVVQINERDNVWVALKDLANGEKVRIGDQEIEVKESIPQGHKMALNALNRGDQVIKYGFPIGRLTEDVEKGGWVHTTNTKTNLEGVQEYLYSPNFKENPFQNQHLTFQGYKRDDGRVGIRNELWIVPTVGCVNGIAELMVKQFKSEVGDIAPFENIHVLKHNYGCSQLGDDHENTKTILGNAINHPNAGGVLVLGLGCENNNIYDLKESLGEFNEDRVKFLVSQDVSDEMEAGVSLLHEIYQSGKRDRREEVPLSELKIGLKCGGSDGFSGITANPLLGRLSDFMAAQNGTTVLTEVPEMFGAESLLMERAANEEVFNETVQMINDFKQYFIQHNQPIYENPSPGNKDGGITTLEDKSLGCTQKAGTSTVQDVLKYGETLTTKGLNLLSSPGNDLVASSALASAGCQLVLFTTGRGTPFGSFVPTVKISTNSQIYEKKKHWIDFDAGKLLADYDPDELLDEFIEYVIQVANGKPVNNEINDFREIAIFKSGVTL
ncbi:altronate dehydratase family protein [Halobacillus salinarum]|uniref:Altronate dehydratase family protein n=1 Tax=Halobacillus salinarum TaxID=2932257 RepID=A0ABY4EPB6_9BACI|nr:altronate dehydratase family protein [Halobacillus salinarum]UOQ45830.1 altronate dehydratase family protein [Halobacillus salinarum]